MSVVTDKQSNRDYLARDVHWKTARAKNAHLMILQEQLILSKFRNFPNIVNVHKVFIDDHTNAHSYREWKMNPDNLWLTTIMDLCYYGNLTDLVAKAPKKKLHWTVARHIAG